MVHHNTLRYLVVPSTLFIQCMHVNAWAKPGTPWATFVGSGFHMNCCREVMLPRLTPAWCCMWKGDSGRDMPQGHMKALDQPANTNCCMKTMFYGNHCYYWTNYGRIRQKHRWQNAVSVQHAIVNKPTLDWHSVFYFAAEYATVSTMCYICNCDFAGRNNPALMQIERPFSSGSITLPLINAMHTYCTDPLTRGYSLLSVE